MTQKDDVSEISRRQILAGLGLAAGAAAVTRAATVPKSDATWDHDTDIVCVGGGASGCTAAVTAVSRGSKVILLEKAPILGGTSRKSGGVAWIPNHSLLRELGKEDRKEDCLRYMSRFSYPNLYSTNSPMFGLEPQSFRLLEAFYDNGSRMIDHLQGTGAVSFGLFTVGGNAPPDYADHLDENKVPTGRALVPNDEHGQALAGRVGHGGRIVDSCETWLTSKGAHILTGHRVMKLIHDGDRVIGVEASADGKTLRVRARKGVIFTSGGFAHNTDLIQLHQKMLYGSCAVPQSTGDFVDIAGALGARMGPMGSAWRTQIVFEEALENRALGLGVFFVPCDSMILVNKYGRRCVNEKRNYNDRTRVHFTYDATREDYPNQLLFMVFDERSLDAFGGQYPVPADARNAAHLIEGADFAALAANLQRRLDALAAKAGSVKLAPDFGARLNETVQRFNGFARSGRDTEFDRGTHAYDRVWQGFFSVMREGSHQPPNDTPNPTMYPIRDHGPYYAVILAAGALDTNAGPLINERSEVLGPGNRPIAGLYAAGNCAASPTREAYYGAGGTLGPGMTFAYIAAVNASGERA